jgi:hypothetical protein
MRPRLLNTSNPPVRIVNVQESRWNRYCVWKPLSLMGLAGRTPPAWEVAIVDENLAVPDYTAMPRLDLVGGLRADCWPARISSANDTIPFDTHDTKRQSTT